MAEINSSSLFHFTKRKNWLKDIITNGVRFSYSFEQMPNKEYGIAIPMACFCDIPLLRTSKHKSRYGEYAIGLDKHILIHYYSPIMNPVTYVHSENYFDAINNYEVLHEKVCNDELLFIAQKSNEMADVYSKCNSDERLELSKKLVNESIELEQFVKWRFSFNFMLGLFKPFQGKNKSGKNICYYDEREWRAFWPNGLSEETNWVYDIDIKDYKNQKQEWNKILKNHKDGHISLVEEVLQKTLTHIIVPKDSDIPAIIEHILQTKTIFGAKNISREDRLMLISRITSFERIENDY